MEAIIIIPILLFSVIVHECAHGWSADKLGDPTARLEGRVTLNPLVHIDPIGTVLVPLLMIIMGFYPIGWAKPVPVNPYNLRHLKRDYLLVSVSGPLANILLAIVFAFFYHVARLLLGDEFLASAGDILLVFLFLAVFLNLLLALFNLIPIPPLDGSGILRRFLPYELEEKYMRIQPFGFIIILALFYLGGRHLLFGSVQHLTMALLRIH